MGFFASGEIPFRKGRRSQEGGRDERRLVSESPLLSLTPKTYERLRSEIQLLCCSDMAILVEEEACAANDAIGAAGIIL